MDKSRWQKLQALFQAALELESERRESYLKEQCGEDSELLDEALALLRADSESTQNSSSASDSLEELIANANRALGSDSFSRQRVAQYDVKEKLGSGGMGIVYQAYDNKLNREVAIKFLPPLLAIDPSIRQRFTKEAKAAASLNHPNIVTVHEVSEQGQIPFIVMEYVDGETLRDVIHSRQVTLAEILTIAIQLCEGLQRAHDAGIIHRDIKPGNIILDSDKRLRILDFGLAKSLDDTSTTRTGSTMGTVEYLSPEQINGATPDLRSDLFSLGVVLYELSTGVSPFRRQTTMGTLQAIVTEPVGSPRSKNPQIPREFEKLAQALLRKEPSERYSSAAEVLADLHRIQQGEHISYQAPKRVVFQTLRRVAVGLTGVAVLLIALIVTGVLPVGGHDVSARSVMVLPFANHGAPEDQYLVDGVTRDITTSLGALEGVQALAGSGIGRIEGDETTRQDSILTVAAGMGANYALSASVRWNKSKLGTTVSIVPELIRLSDRKQIWSGSFEKPFAELFSAQSELISRIAAALDVAVSQRRQLTLARRPTESMEAYNFYLRGLDYYRRGNSWENRLLALSMYQRAVEIDTAFAMAYARIGEIHSLMYYAYYDHSRARLDSARIALDVALALDDKLPETHTVLGLYYYWGFRDYSRALQEFEKALTVAPNRAEIHNDKALVLRRMGKWEETVAELKRATELDPFSQQYVSNLAESLIFTRRYAAADTLWDRVIWLTPDWAWAYAKKARLQILWRGDVAGAVAIIEAGRSQARRGTLDLEYVRALQHAGQVQKALKLLTLDAILLNETDEPRDTARFYEIKGELYGLIDSVRQQAFLDTALQMLLDSRRAGGSGGYRGQLRLATALARVHRKAEAVQAYGMAEADSVASQDILARAGLLTVGAEVFTRIGEYDRALKLLDSILSMPSLLSAQSLELEPRWRPLRNLPGYQRLIQRFSSHT